MTNSILLFVFLILSGHLLKGQEKNCSTLARRTTPVHCTLSISNTVADTSFVILPPSCNEIHFPTDATGIWKIYQSDSIHLIESVELQNGKRNGTSILYYSSGVLNEIATYKNDQLVGTYRSYFPNGKMKMDGIYTVTPQIGSQFTGSAYKHWDNGQMAQKEFFERDGWIAIREQFWDPEGRNIDEATFHKLWNCN